MRRQNWDYSKMASYMVTISITDQEESLSNIVGGEVELTESGEIIEREWLLLPSIFKYIEIEEFVIMPDHFHGIIHFYSNSEEDSTKGNEYGFSKGNLPAVIRRFKSGSSHRIRKAGKAFKWHTSFHDRIIYSEQAKRNMRNYILNNPKKAAKK